MCWLILGVRHLDDARWELRTLYRHSCLNHSWNSLILSPSWQDESAAYIRVIWGKQTRFIILSSRSEAKVSVDIAWNSFLCKLMVEKKNRVRSGPSQRRYVSYLRWHDGMSQGLNGFAALIHSLKMISMRTFSWSQLHSHLLDHSKSGLTQSSFQLVLLLYTQQRTRKSPFHRSHHQYSVNPGIPTFLRYTWFFFPQYI